MPTAPPPPEPLTLSLPDGQRLAALAWGPAQGTPALALHGWLDNAATFSALAPRLRDHRIVALDLPGHGLSDHRPPGASYHFIDWIPTVIAALDQLGWTRSALVGHSMGAGVAALTAAVEPERVTRVALLEGLGPLSTEADEAPAQLLRALRAERVQTARPPRLYPDVEAVVARRLEHGDLAPASARALIARSVETTAEGVRLRADPRLRLPSRLRLSEAHVQAFLRAIRCPALVVRARDGWPSDPARLADRLACLPRAQTLEVDGGHHVHLDAPEHLSDALQAFLDAGSASA